VKYSEATIIELTVKEVDHSLEFAVRDNGIGFDHEIVKRGNGLENMQKRAEDIGAKLHIEAGAQKGSTISVRVSLHE
jgi:signal transduction histidine kinase